MIAIVDYGVGNLFSLKSSLAHLGLEAVVTADPAQLRAADRIILPGVGAFGDAMEKLNQYGLTEVVREVAQAGIPLVGVAMKQKSTGADRFINEYRTLIGMHITYKTGVREMFAMLQKGWAIGLIMDQDTNRRSGIVLDFFGKPTNCVPGAASMARFQGVPIFPAFMHRDEHGFHTLIVQDPVFVEKTKDKREDIRRTTQVLTKCIEDHVRRYPEEWFWLHDRWKSMREEY